jgi:hypothetical protein
MIYSTAEISAMTSQDCEQALVSLERDYPLDRAWNQLTAAEWLQVDAIADCLNDILDRQRQILQEQRAAENYRPPAAAVPVRPVRPEPVIRQFRIDNEIFASIQAASEASGVKIETLKAYTSRKRDRYSYID